MDRLVAQYESLQKQLFGRKSEKKLPSTKKVTGKKKLKREDVTVLGVPLARLMFGNDPMLGLIIAPIMLYHVFQLVVLGVLANRYARRPAD